MPMICCYPSFGGVNAIAMGLQKSGTQQLTQTAAWTRVTSWTPLSGFPSTVQSGDGIALNAGNYTFAFSVYWSSTFVGNTQEAHLVDASGVEVTGTYQTGANTDPTTLSGSMYWPGGVIYLEARSNNSTSTRRLIQATSNFSFTPA